MIRFRIMHNLFSSSSLLLITAPLIMAPLIVAPLIIAPMAHAADDTLDKALPSLKKKEIDSDNAATKSLEDILKKAGEQGFITYDTPQNNTKIISSPLPVIKGQTSQNNKALTPSISVNTKAIRCSATTVLDYSIYQSVSSYADIAAAKSLVKTGETFEDILGLAKTYISLGFGAEATDLAVRYEDDSAQLMATLGRVISQDVTPSDLSRLQSYSECNDKAKFWAVAAQASYLSPDITPDETAQAFIPLTQSRSDTLQQLPPELKALISLRLAIYQAELGHIKVAERMLKQVEAETAYGKLPKNKSDERLYLFAMVRQAKGDPKASQIFKHLGQYDGLYQIRALEKLALSNTFDEGQPYAEFSDDLKAVSQQYNGHSQSRIAMLQVMRHYVGDGQFIDAIETTKREFKPSDIEFGKAVDLVGRHIETGLSAAEKPVQIYALNGYMYDPDFFETYDKSPALRTLAIDTAIGLNLPEVVKRLPKTPLLNDSKNTQQLAYAEAKAAFKSGQYDAAIKAAAPYTADNKFNELIIEASLRSGNRKTALEALDRKPAENARFEQQAEMAWQHGNWGEAKSALEALTHKAPDQETADKLIILDYISANAQPYNNFSVPNSLEGMDMLIKQLSQDTAIVKGYLKNG